MKVQILLECPKKGEEMLILKILGIWFVLSVVFFFAFSAFMRTCDPDR